MVEDVEEVRACLEGKALSEVELAAEREVDFGGAESFEGVTNEVALNGSGGDAECGFVDALSAGDVGVGAQEWCSGHQIRTLYAGGFETSSPEGSRRAAHQRGAPKTNGFGTAFDEGEISAFSRARAASRRSPAPFVAKW